MLEIIVRTIVCYLLWLLAAKAFGFDKELSNWRWHIGNIVCFMLISTVFVVGGN